MTVFQIFIGYEPRQAEAFMVCQESVKRSVGSRAIVRGLSLSDLIRRGWYNRPTNRRFGALIDELSIREDYNGELSTEHANARFFLPYLAERRDGWAIFLDNDTLVRGDMTELFAELEGRQRDFALVCVPHDHQPAEFSKMDNQRQTSYWRKNWSSMMAMNLAHPANDRLTGDMLNGAPGRDLHRFCWLRDEEIGSFSAEWNWLVRVEPEPACGAKIVHWTLGGPWLPAFAGDPYANEYFDLRDEIVTRKSFFVDADKHRPAAHGFIFDEDKKQAVRVEPPQEPATVRLPFLGGATAL